MMICVKLLSLLSQERGLKLLLYIQTLCRYQSLLSQERGLKHHLHHG